MSYSMQDIVHWSLIYSAQNEKHEAEIKLMQEKLNNEKLRMQKFALMMIMNILNSCINEFNDTDSDSWKQFNTVVDIIHETDIDMVAAEMLEVVAVFDFECRKLIQSRAQICKQRLKALCP